MSICSHGMGMLCGSSVEIIEGQTKHPFCTLRQSAATQAACT